MKKILSVLLILILVSCQFVKNKEALNSKLIDQFATIKLEPEEFIKSLPSKLKENSGIIFYDNLIWTLNDSGGKDELYGLNFSGEIVKEIEIDEAKNKDWEDIAQDEKHIYIGDFGNNRGNRNDQCIYKINKKDIGKKKKQKIKAKKIKFDFENQTNFNPKGRVTPFDCEAMTVFNDSIYIFTKDWSDRTTTVFKMPTDKGEYKIRPDDKFNVDALVTGADISPDKTKLALIGYKNHTPILWIFSDFESDNFFKGDKVHMEMDTIYDAQTEGICFLGNDSILVSCERSGTFVQQIFLINLTPLNEIIEERKSTDLVLD